MFEWDEAKSARNLRERGFDFDIVARIFAGPLLERVDRRRDYGEGRVKAIGEWDGQVYAVIYTWRGKARRIISARFANRSERNDYRAEVATRTDEN